MGPGKKIDTENLLSLGTDLVGVLGTNKDGDNLTQLKEGLRALRSSCRDDSHEVHYYIEDYQKKINECKAKIENVKGGTVEDAEFERLQREFEAELQTERLLRQELREVCDELDSLERQRVSFEERKNIVKEREKDVLRAEDLLSMCASVTNIIPNLDDEKRIAGFIFDKKKKKGEKFEFDPTSTPVAICNELWNIADAEI